jgi:hypothetical protein
MSSRISRASDSVFAKVAATSTGLPETDKEWDDFFRANEWRGNEHVDNEHPTAGNYGARPGEDPESQRELGKQRASLFPRPARDLTDRDQTVCHDCACYMANGEGNPEHERRFENGMRELQAQGVNPWNLTLDHSDEEGNRVPPSDDKCVLCGQRVDPDMDNFYADRGEGTIGLRAHLFQPGDPGYHAR